MILGILGGLLGGILRMAPKGAEVLEKKMEMNHELEMTKLQIEQAKVQGSIRMDEASVEMTKQELATIQEAFKEQAAEVAASYRWVAAISALVRPVVTWWFVTLYSIVRMVQITHAVEMGGLDALVKIYGEEDFAMLNMILSFWFVSRVWDKKSKEA